jgi:hypothetical protein
VLILKQFIPAGFQRQFLDNSYQKFSYFKNCIIFPQKIFLVKIKSILQKSLHVQNFISLKRTFKFF